MDVSRKIAAFRFSDFATRRLLMPAASPDKKQSARWLTASDGSDADS